MAQPHPSSDPRLCFSVDNIRAFHLQNGEEAELTPSGPQTLSLLMVPTTAQSPDNGADEDFYLHLHLPPELDLPLPATTQIYHQPPDSYLIPRWDLGPDAGAFTRIKFPPIGSGPGKVSQEEVDTFETILAQCTAFLERSAPPSYHLPYNPAQYGPGEGYIGNEKENSQNNHGQIVLVDEENGSVVGELGEGFTVAESSDVKPGSKDPVQIQLPPDGHGPINVSNAPPEYLRMASHPAYSKSSLVQSSATASRLLVTTSMTISKALESGANTFTTKTKPAPKPVTFTPTTQAHIRRINTFTGSAADLSAKTVGHITKYAQNFGASLAKRGEKDGSRGFDQNGKPIPNYKPGILNKSMIAFSTLGDGLEQGARNLLESGAFATSTVVGHRYGPEAGEAAAKLTGGVRNVGLVYIDASGVSRRALLKSVAKGMVVGRMPDGQQLIVGAGDGGQVPSSANSPPGQSGSNQHSNGMPHYPRRPSPSPTPPPAYGARGGISLGGTPMQGPGSKR